MIRPNVKINDELGAVLKYHCTRQGISLTQYIVDLIYADLLDKQSQLMKDVTKEV